MSSRYNLYSNPSDLNKNIISCLFSRHSLYSNPSEPDNSELNTSMTGAGLLGQSWALSLCLQGDEVEDVWKSHVSKVMAEASVQHAIRTCQVFPRLYRVSWMAVTVGFVYTCMCVCVCSVVTVTIY